MSEPWVAFRVDASLDMGSGHWMRCLTFADALAVQGHQSLFLYQASLGGLEQRTRDHRHGLLPLALAAPSEDRDRPYAHSHWLPTTEAADAEASRLRLADEAEQRGRPPSWVVVDHYALARPWEECLNTLAPVLAIDDLGDRPHGSQLLLDQTYGVTEADYRGRVRADCRCFLGADYALVRPEFAEAREASLARRHGGRQERPCLLVTLGGVDRDNVGRLVLEALRPLRFGVELEMIAGGANPHSADLADWCRRHWPEARVVKHCERMSHTFARADLCIGAAGATSWERCTLGLPTIQLCLADNQTRIAYNLGQAGAALDFGILTPDRVMELGECTTALLKDPDRLATMSRAAAAVCDGRGVERVAAELPEYMT